MNCDQESRLHACDYSAKAIDVIRSQPAYTAQESPAVLRADVWEIASQELPPGLTPGTVDLVLLIFIFSALSADQWAQALHDVSTILKPGGEVLFLDYGRGDLAQVRFKKGRYLDANFYVRRDGTRVYFFEEKELRDVWSGNVGEAARDGKPTVAFEVRDLAVDRRMLVNKQRKLKMYRCWMQGRFRKPVPEEDFDSR
ncbi:hypothetical protein LTR73_009181 [Friedmanniomyces endolithicus]|uniref:Methyltransferase type 12 domain-containing protein n=1 Tax=Friedmanniomyces endolithicus TaxID=329885 RepID=A0AAN6IZH3_9PEZI|nr:hypothetical protein LTR82_017709 [Friedmanniomyces endolithicus]KAK0822615.1 hypothetical protein LTR73_009181 [Friedmanniomyces endolithicus]